MPSTGGPVGHLPLLPVDVVGLGGDRVEAVGEVLLQPQRGDREQPVTRAHVVAELDVLLDHDAAVVRTHVVLAGHHPGVHAERLPGALVDDQGQRGDDEHHQDQADPEPETVAPAHRRDLRPRRGAGTCGWPPRSPAASHGSVHGQPVPAPGDQAGRRRLVVRRAYADRGRRPRHREARRPASPGPCRRFDERMGGRARLRHGHRQAAAHPVALAPRHPHEHAEHGGVGEVPGGAEGDRAVRVVLPDRHQRGEQQEREGQHLRDHEVERRGGLRGRAGHVPLLLAAAAGR